MVGSSLLGRLALQFQPGILCRERRLLVREVHFGAGRHCLLVGFGRYRLGNRLDTGTLRTRRSIGFRNGFFCRGRFCFGFFRRRLFRYGFLSRRRFRNRFLCHGRFRFGFFRHGFLCRGRFHRGHFRDGFLRRRRFRNGFFCRGRFRHGFRLRRCGGLGFRDFGSRFGSYSLHIFSSIADLLLGSRKIRIFSSHLSTRF